MYYSRQQIYILLWKYVDGTATTVEQEILFQWIGSNDDETVGALLHQCFGEAEEGVVEQRKESVEAIFKSIVGQPQQVLGGKWYRLPWVRYVAAAVVMLVIGISILLSRKAANEVLTEMKPVMEDVMPGKNGGILLLADGRQILLDSVKNGELELSNNIRLMKKDSVLSYVPARAGEMIVMNTIQTPAGREYSLELSDGTKVWLNAASSIHFPVSFTGKQREVFITGEVYFEVVKDSKKPFLVSTSQMKVEVLGTKFNINAYENEKTIKTTLIEGSVRLISGKQKMILRPGQQAKLVAIGLEKKFIVDEVEDRASQAVSWKTAAFTFEQTEAEVVLRQIARWYNVELEFPDGIPAEKISGRMGKNLKLSEALFILKALGIQAELTNGRLVVTQR